MTSCLLRLCLLATCTSVLTVACDLARLGAGPEDVGKYLHWNRLNIAQAYIAEHGRKIYGPWSEQNLRHDGYAIVDEQIVPPDAGPNNTDER